jgi:hypothetical protein
MIRPDGWRSARTGRARSLSVAAKLYLQYPERTVGEYAERNSVDLQALLPRLNAEAEASEHVTAGRRPRATARRWPPEGPLGYTGSYVELKDSGIETEPFVASLLARGP